MRVLPLALLLGLVVVPVTVAQAAEPADDHKRASITFSPIHLAFPIVELTGEYAVNKKIGVAGIAGVGSVPLETTTVGGTKTTEKLSAWEVGAHFNYYVLGGFDHGMQLGAEAIFVKIAKSETDYSSAATANGLAIGPYVGYKVIANIGFTFEANLGFQYVTARADASAGTSSASAKRKDVVPLLNLNVGWSF